MSRVRDENLYGRWNMMKQRCSNPNNHKYKDYGARGIKVCDGWLDYHTFKEWSLNNGFKEHLTIDRIDTNGNYEPSNCRWVSQKVQQNNRSNNRLINYEGKQYTLAQLSRKTGVKPDTISQRLNNGMSVHESLKINVNLKELCKQRGLSYKTIHARVSRGWSIERALNTPIRKGNYKRSV